MRLTLLVFTLLFVKPAALILLSQNTSSNLVHHVSSAKTINVQERKSTLEKHVARLFHRHETLTEIHLSVGRTGVYPIAGVDQDLDQLKELYREAVSCLEAMEDIRHEKWHELEKQFLKIDLTISKAQKVLVKSLSQNKALVSLYRT